jgi:hypothetical protein
LQSSIATRQYAVPSRAHSFEAKVLEQQHKLHAQRRRYSPYVPAESYVWLQDDALHLEALFEGTSALYAAVSSNQHDAVKLLLQAGANPLRACYANPADAIASTSTSSSATSKKKKKKQKAGDDDEGSSNQLPGPRWTTPLHAAAKRGDVSMLQLLLTLSKHALPDKIQQELPEVRFPTNYSYYSDDKDCAHSRLQKLPVTLLDGEGQTPLSLALCSRSAAAAQAGVLLLDAGVQLLQPVKDLSGGENGEGITHALLIGAKVIRNRLCS